MNGLKRIKAAMAKEPVDRVPWVPFVGCHGGFLNGVDAETYLKSEDLIVNGVNTSIKRYQPDGIPVMFDLQIEAEVLGCELLWAKENPPAVSSHPLRQGKTLKDLTVPQKTEGRLPIVLNAVKKVRELHPDIALYGLITGPLTLALHLSGTELFIEMYDNEEGTKELMDFCKKVCLAMADYYIEAGCDVIAVVDPMTSQIGSDQFKQFVSAPMTEIFSHVRQQQTLSSFFVCGYAQQNIEVMCECAPDNVSVDENIPLDFVKETCLKHNVSFGGNLQLTVVLLLGSEQDAARNAFECLETGGNNGFILSPGCDLPYATPPENLEAVTNVILNPYHQEVITTLAEQDEAQELYDMSDYGNGEKVKIDIITLDSESCAPCQYMVEAVKAAVPEFEGMVDWTEYKIKHPESIKMMSSLGVKNIPTICLDGDISFVSRIPPKEELVAAIRDRVSEKSAQKN